MQDSRDDAFLSLITRTGVSWTVPMRALWTSCIDWALSVDLIQKTVLDGIKATLWAGGSQSPAPCQPHTTTHPDSPVLGGHITQPLRWESNQFIVFTYPGRAHYTDTTIVLTQENLCLFPVHMCYKSLLHLAHVLGTASFPSAPAVEKGERNSIFIKDMINTIDYA